jgi:hypothetical protein
MTTLEERIRRMTPPSVPVTPVADIQARAAKRRIRRRVVVGLCTVAVLAVVVGLLRVSADEAGVNVGPPPSDPAPTQRTIGDVTGVTVEVTPSTWLVDGQTVRVSIDGLHRLPAAQLGMCRGDVTDLLDQSSCSQTALQSVGASTLTAAADQELVVSSVLRLGDERDLVYDCATEPAGCVLAVGTAPPLRGVLVPLEFVAGSRASTAPTASIAPVSGLTAGATVVITASDLPVNRTFDVLQCASGADRGNDCQTVGIRSITADASGSLTGEVAVDDVLFTLGGLVDCTQSECVILIADFDGTAIAAGPLQFDPGVEPALPSLTIEPAGPYRDGQVVTVNGVGFPPGEDLGSHLGRCPAWLDTRVEERCAYSLGGPTVAADGTFSASITLNSGLLVGSCRDEPGCVLGWVIPNGPTVAAVPLPFSG